MPCFVALGSRHMFWTKEMFYPNVLSVCFSCKSMLVFPTRMKLPAVWPWVRGFPCFIPLPSFPIQISEVKENGCPANACWCSPQHRMEMPAASVVALGER